MKTLIKSFLRQILPPVVLSVLKKRSIHWRGNYPDWQSAKNDCQGYDKQAILDQIDIATEKIVSGQFPYERDSVVFDEIQYSWPLLTGLLWSHSLHGKLNVMDIGGSLGSTYRQNIKFLKSIDCKWNIVEQKNYVALGNLKYQTAELKFFDSIEDCLSKNSVNTLVISSTLQYLEDPMSFLEKLGSFKIPVLLLDRVSIIDSSENRLTKQTVPKDIYSASYPCWFFSENKILEILKKDYELVEKFEAFVKNETFIDGQTRSQDYGYILKRK